MENINQGDMIECTGNGPGDWEIGIVIGFFGDRVYEVYFPAQDSIYGVDIRDINSVVSWKDIVKLIK